MGVLALVEDYRSGWHAGRGCCSAPGSVSPACARAISTNWREACSRAAQAEAHTNNTSGAFFESISRPFSLHSRILSPVLWVCTHCRK